MNRRKIYGIVVLMSIALTGLVGFQGYWISQTVEANQQRFEQHVYEALNSVVNQLERQEAYGLAYQTLDQRVLQLDTNGLYPIASSSSQLRIIQRGQRQSYVYTYNQVTGRPSEGRPSEGRPSEGQPFGERQASGQSPANPRPEVDVSVGVTPNDSPAILTVRPSVPENDPHLVYRERIRKMEQRTDMFEDAIQQLITGSRPLHSRVSNQQIDTLLRVALGDRGINTPYDYAVVDARADSILMANTPQLAQFLPADARVLLFPNDFVPSRTFLNVKFPQQRWYLLKQIWTTLLSSLLFTGVVIYCFVYAINTIFRQKKLSDMKNDFINNMTHELKTPISTVSLAVEALQDEQMSQNPTILQRYLDIIKEENSRLGSQVERVLQIASLDKKDFTLKKEEVNVHQLIRNIEKNTAPVIGQREGTLTIELGADRPTVCADPHHLANVLTNLIDNANKYSPEAPRITLRTKNTRTGLIIEVKDQGMGMTREVQHRVFDKFYRAPTGNLHDVKGFGLGLSYVQSIVEAHEGQVSVDSKPGEGSTFTVYLPYDYEGITR